jgi:hypothetical protein
MNTSANIRGRHITCGANNERISTNSPPFGVQRTKIQKQRFSPLRIRPCKASDSKSIALIPIPHQDRDNILQYGAGKAKHRRSQAISVAMDRSLPLAGEPLEVIMESHSYMTNQDLDSNRSVHDELGIYEEQPINNDPREIVRSHLPPIQVNKMPRTKVLSGLKVKNKENASIPGPQRGSGSPTCSDTARERKRLMLTQKLPTVVISPPSGESLRESNSNSNSGSLNWKEMI